MNRNALLPLSLLLLSLCACGDRDAASPAGEAPTAENGAAAPGQPAGDTAPGPISSHGGAVPEGMPPAAQPQTAAAIDFDLPKSWQAEAPTSEMRVAQATIPGPGGPGELVVFYFGAGGGGGVDANIQRWVGQMETTEQPKPETFEANGYKVTWVDVRGTLQPSTMGTGPTTAQANSRLMGAVVEGPGGPWFFKATGPDATLAAERDAFVTMLKSVRAKSQAA